MATLRTVAYRAGLHSLARCPRLLTKLPALQRAPADFRVPSLCRSFSELPADSKDINMNKFKEVDQDGLDLSHLLTANQWSHEELQSISVTHRDPGDWVDSLAYRSVQLCRSGFDFFSGYKWKMWRSSMHERDWLRRVIFLETVAGVPGMMAGMVRHLHSLRLMRRDHGWIHSLLAEAENERMHLLIALNLRRPGIGFRALVIGGQAIFLFWYTFMYLVCPRYCHRFVGYLEEEAVHTYSKLLQAIDSGELPMFSNMKAPLFARQYYNLPKDAMLRDVFEQIRADEACHRDANHHFSDIPSDAPNRMVDHLRKGHFTHQNAHAGVLKIQRETKAKIMKETFKEMDTDADGFITKEDLRKVFEQHETPFTLQELDDMLSKADRDDDGRIDYEEFVRAFESTEH